VLRDARITQVETTGELTDLSICQRHMPLTRDEKNSAGRQFVGHLPKVPREAHLVLFGCGPKGDLFGLQKRPGLPVCGSEIPSLFSCPKDCD